jgi:uncharacterized peroxidase-related enzyme
VLPLLYPDLSTREALLADPQTAPIPPVHRELFRFAEMFVRGSWRATPADLERLRDLGLSDRDIVLWATLGSTQSWFTMSADGGGVPLEGDALSGPGVGRNRDAYAATEPGLLAATGLTPRPDAVSHRLGIAWVDTDESSGEYLQVAGWAKARYGRIPNLLRAVSLLPGYLPRHQMALELLEAPQSASLSARLHAMVRVRASHLVGSSHSAITTDALLSRITGDAELAGRIRRESLDADLSALERTVLTLATKISRNAYKITEKDALLLREAGLDDEAYVDILNTVSIQVSLDRLANVLGVEPDGGPLLALS